MTKMKEIGYRFLKKGNKTKDITIIIGMGMGFTQQYFGSKPDEVEGMLALIEYIALSRNS